ncbi:DNA mismatch repair endonuclease MutL [Geitlerinema sp. P-1104]|uniref:DNA mismatch repair endonuclease MutL n=1 Tax=Geitlerinema sp. P-1104 TaxID=2546230 RepID=UPI00147774C2|nr:DNA mismatch repair endonuclease MutL [Geitlerinema sp. P-1104]NMG57252.1 DNA mismatch repair endonuclease MutL [Geitlerinema sp. P-1104]
MPKIATLPAEVVHAIAAGEVIDSLAAVVRELAENALDAGASRIAISVNPQQWSVSVADNGCGMSREDLQQAASPHSTSKIHDFNDLHQVTSLGFRGEALHSLAQLAQLTIYSRPGDNTGWQAHYSRQGHIKTLTPTAIAPGTVVEVNHVFQHWPQRRDALPSPPQQLRGIQQVLQNLALCHPQVSWQIRKGNKPWFSLTPGPSPREILPQLLRGVTREDVYYSRDSSLELLLGRPDRCHRGRSDWLKFAVNGRVVNLPDLEHTLLSALSRSLPRNRYPLCFLHLRVPPEQLDWNRHPAKSEIYLQNTEHWQTQLREAIDRALALGSLDNSGHSRVHQLLRVQDSPGDYRVNPASTDPSTDPSSRPLMPLRAIGQANRTYIVAEHPDGLWLVEQHIAHERVIYEQLCQDWALQELDPPIILSGLSPQQLENLDQIGITVDPFGDGLWALRQAPLPLAQRDDCADALQELSKGNLQDAQVATACRSAIRNGTLLTLKEMQQLLDRWQQTRNPHTCPHGRPIYLPLNESSLGRYFRRSWVIGKSHGI